MIIYINEDLTASMILFGVILLTIKLFGFNMKILFN
jgi:hypothetical protein